MWIACPSYASEHKEDLDPSFHYIDSSSDTHKPFISCLIAVGVNYPSYALSKLIASSNFHRILN